MVEFLAPPKQDSEFDLERVDSLLCTCVAISPSLSSPPEESLDPKSVSMGDVSWDFSTCRSLALRLAYCGIVETGESGDGTRYGEFEFVLGFDSLLWWLL